MTSYIIIEDELDIQELLFSVVSKQLPQLVFKGNAPSIIEAKKLLDKEGPDIVFADIHLLDGNIFQLLKRVEIIDFSIIFITAFDQYALKAFEYGAINYLLKPFDSADVVKSVERIEVDKNISDKLLKISNDFLNRSNKIGFPTSTGITMIDIGKIVHIEADRSYSSVHMSNHKKILVSRPLGDLEAKLPEKIFYRVHASHLVNLNHIDSFEKKEGGFLKMSNGLTIPVSRRKRKYLLAKLLD